MYGRVLLGRQLVQVLVDRRGRLGLVLDAVEAGEQERGEGQVRVRRGVRAAELNPLGFRVGPVIGIRMAAERLRELCRQADWYWKPALAGE
jgi:hypothetical protein